MVMEYVGAGIIRDSLVMGQSVLVEIIGMTLVIQLQQVVIPITGAILLQLLMTQIFQ